MKVLCERYKAETEFDPTCEALLEGKTLQLFLLLMLISLH